jgi:hypothetical protein
VCVCVCVQLTADETSILNKLQAVDATATPAAAVDTAEGAPALLKKLQSVIVEVCLCACACVSVSVSVHFTYVRIHVDTLTRTHTHNRGTRQNESILSCTANSMP